LPAQAAPKDWLKPATQTITRDPSGIGIIESAIKAMNPHSLPPITDTYLQFSVSQWAGQPASGTCLEASVGYLSQFQSLSINGDPAEHVLIEGGSRLKSSADGSASTVSDERAFERIPLFPPLLLQEALSNSTAEILSLPADPERPTQTAVRITIHGPTWTPSLRDLYSASFDVFFDTSTYLPKSIAGNMHTDGHLRHTVPHEVVYDDYQNVASLYIPSSVKERLAGKTTIELALIHAKFNQGLTSENMVLLP
jgi:hypothetical protein